MKKFEIIIQIRFKDVDSMGHVNNAVYFTYFEQGRLEFYMKNFGPDAFKIYPFILARAEANFLKEIKLTEEKVKLKMWIGEFGNKSFKFYYELVSMDEKSKFAEGKTVQVFYDYNTKKTIPVPEDFKEKVKEYVCELD